MRLAFSVATAVRPDILIVDEALSVGDAYFQHKSFDAHPRSSATRARRCSSCRTSPAAVKTLCDRAILLDQGVLLRDGAPGRVLDYYNAMIAAQRGGVRNPRRRRRLTGGTMTRSGILRGLDRGGRPAGGRAPVRALRSGAPATFESPSSRRRRSSS